MAGRSGSRREEPPSENQNPGHARRSLGGSCFGRGFNSRRLHQAEPGFEYESDAPACTEMHPSAAVCRSVCRSKRKTARALQPGPRRISGSPILRVTQNLKGGFDSEAALRAVIWAQARNGVATSENQTTPKTRTSSPATTPMAIRSVRLAGGLTLKVIRAATARIKAINSAAAYWNAHKAGRLGEVELTVIVTVMG